MTYSLISVPFGFSQVVEDTQCLKTVLTVLEDFSPAPGAKTLVTRPL
jgi:Na+/H+ antiporter NhaC